MSANPHRVKKIEKLRQIVIGSQLSAAKHVRDVVEGRHADSDVPWKEVTGRTRAALALTQGTMAAQRAETMSQAPAKLGVIVVHKRLEDTPENRSAWERDAARLNETRKSLAIDAVATAKEPNAS